MIFGLPVVAFDTSALVALFLQEESEADFGFLLHRKTCLIGWPTLFEFRMVLSARAGAQAEAAFDYLLSQPNVKPVSFDDAHMQAAFEAFARFGRPYGRSKGHPAKLNFGDCLAYAVARVHGVPLVFKGEDFALTDINEPFKDLQASQRP